MDLSAVTGSPAYLALQTLAASNASTTAASADQPTAVRTDANETVEVDAAAGRRVDQDVGHALSAADAAGSAGRAVLGLLTQMQASATTAADPTLATAERQSLDQDFQSTAAAIGPTLRSAEVGGANLVDGSLTAGLKVGLGDGVQTVIGGLDLTATGPILGLNGTSLSTPEAAQAAQASLQTGGVAAAAGLDGLQTQAATLAAHAALIQSFGPTAAVPPTDDGGDGARLLALQVSQQLSVQPSTAIANASPKQILALLRSS